MTRARRLVPGSLMWLIAHEIRLAFRGPAGTRWWGRAGPRLLLAAVPTVAGIALAATIALTDRHPAAPPDTATIGFATAGVAFLLVLMISTASVTTLRAFHGRGDLDLLLAAPLPPPRVLTAKALGVAVTVATPFLVLVAPFALTRAVLGAPHWLGAIAVVAIDATLATAAAILVTGRLASAIGTRRARVMVQLVVALASAAAFLSTQAQMLAPKLAHRVAVALDRPLPAPLDWPGRAALGEPIPLAGLALAAAVALAAAARFGVGALAAAGDAGGGGPAAWTTKVVFRGGLTRIVVAKELQLIARDPELITQIALRLVYLIPLAALLTRGRHGVDPGPALAGGATGFAGLLASSLAWIVVAAEDAPDLLAAAPQTASRVFRAKLVATCAVPLAIVAAAAAVALPLKPVAAPVTLALGGVAVVTAALLQAWFGKPAPRSAFRRRAQASFVIGVGEIVLAGAWAGTASLLVRGSVWAAAPAVLAGMIMAGAVEARREKGQRAAAPGSPSAGGSGSSSSVSSAVSPRQPAT